MGLSLSNPSTSVNSKLLAGKSNTAVEQSLGSASITGANGTSAYGQISASLGSDTLVTAVEVFLGSSQFTVANQSYVDIAYGGAGSETVLASVPLQHSYNGSTYRRAVGRLVIPARVASGQRLAVRITDQVSAVTVTIYVYGAPYANTEGN